MIRCMCVCECIYVVVVVVVVVGGGGCIVCLGVHVFLRVCTCIICVVWYTRYLIQVSPHPSGSPGEPHKKIEELSDSANSAKVRLLFIQWWVEYSSNYDKLCPWLKGAESRRELAASGEGGEHPESASLPSRAAASCQGR